MEIRRCMNCMEELSENNGICPACGTDNRKIEQPNYALQCGAMLHGRYFVGKVLGQGGFGITYIGLDLLFNVKVAVKEYFPMGLVTRDSGGSSKILWNTSQASQSQRQSGYDSFLKEARKMARIDEIPSIVRVRDLFLENETAYIVMDFVEGTTLKQKLSQEGPMVFSECLALLRPMMEDLAKVHKQGMIHRDISPDNIMIKTDGSVRLLDLGAAKDMTMAHGVSSQVVAKKGFSPFEQYKSGGEVGPWTDVYALCATIYYCITGKLLPDAFDRIDEEEINFSDNLKEPLSKEKKEALRAGLAVRLKMRTQSVEELLRHFASGESLSRPVDKSEQKKDTKEGSFTAGNSMPGKPPKQQSMFVREHKNDLKATLKSTGLPLMMSDVLPEESDNDSNVVLGRSSVKRSEVHKITFLDKLENVAGNAWDVSAEQDGSVLAWTEPEQGGGYHLYIGGKGGVMAPKTCKDLFSGYCQVSEINFNGCFDTSLTTDMRYMFKYCKILKQLDVSSFNTSRVTDMRYMFYECANLEELDLSSFDTSKVTNMGGMFWGCKNVDKLDVSSFDTRQVTDMRGMFLGCGSLKKLDVGGFDTSRVTDMECMFYRCRNLSQLDVSGFNMSHVTDKKWMFDGCENLR